MHTTVESLDDGLVRLVVDVPEDTLEAAIDRAFRKIAREVRIPGFRPGKAPRRLLEQRVGLPVARAEAINDSLSDFYLSALGESGLDPIARPDIEVTSGEAEGPLQFAATVKIRPRATVIGYGGIRVTVPSPTASDEEIDAQVQRFRDRSATWDDVTRPAATDDLVTIDLTTTVEGDRVDSFSGDDVGFIVGQNEILAGMNDQLLGAKAGDILEFVCDVPGAGEDGAPASGTVRVLVKAVRERVLPELNDQWAADAMGSDSLEAFRSELGAQLGRMKRAQAALAWRDETAKAVCELVDIDPPDELIAPAMQSRVNDFLQRLSREGVALDQYLSATGRSEQDLLEMLRAGARDDARLDLALRAVAEAESLDASDEEVDSEITLTARGMKEKPAKLRARLVKAGRLPDIRAEISKGKALQWLLERVEIVDEHGAAVSRDELRLDLPAPAAVVDASDDHDDDDHDHDHDDHDHDHEH